VNSTTPQKWTLSGPALERLLDALGPDAAAASVEYEELRRRLIHFFDWRGSLTPDVQADETLDRVARKLEQGEVVANIRSYTRAVAGHVFQEAERRRARERAALETAARMTEAVRPPDQADMRLPCLKTCLADLPQENRELLVLYYEGEGRCHLTERKSLAARLGLTYAALKARAHRARGLLEECLRTCLEGGRRGDR
jgi:DNA-directed RNA polymerase specialized sigma24 family protein